MAHSSRKMYQLLLSVVVPNSGTVFIQGQYFVWCLVLTSSGQLAELTKPSRTSYVALTFFKDVVHVFEPHNGQIMLLYYLSDVVTVLSLDTHTNTDRPFAFAGYYLL